VLCVDNYFTGRKDNIADLLPLAHFEALRHDITPIGMHYVLVHFDVPIIDARRHRLAVDGVPVGTVIDRSLVPEPVIPEEHGGPGAGPGGANRGAGSIIVIVATDAPLLPTQCRRLAQRAGLGVARTGGVGEHSSGDIFLSFSTANRGLPPAEDGDPPLTSTVEVLSNQYITPLFDAVVEATEEAIVNALVAAETMVGRDGVTAHAIPHDRLVAALERFGRGRERG
jgi:D-aminopeptidase